MKLPNNSSQYHTVGPTQSDTVDVCTEQTFEKDLQRFLAFRRNPRALASFMIYLIGMLATPLSLLGVSLGYARMYNRLWRAAGILPRLHNLPRVFKIGMALGVMFVWLAIAAIFVALVLFASTFDFLSVKFVLTYLTINAFISLAVFIAFKKWVAGVYNLILQSEDFGSARFAADSDLADYKEKPGIYIGGDYIMSHKGHVTTFASTRSGKGACLIIPNLLGRGGFDGSIVCIDVKGENAAVTGKYLKKMGKRVIYLNPWDILSGLISSNSSFNPLDMLSDTSSEHCIDDIAILCEMIIPLQPDSENAFFMNSARNVLSGLMLYLVCTYKKPTLTDLWMMTRLTGEDWDTLLLSMFDSKHKVYGTAIQTAAREIAKMMEAGETWSSIVSNIIEATAFLKSRPVQDILKSNLNPYSIADGNTVVFIVFPFTKLKSHSQVLRLMVTSLMQSVAAKPDKKVLFLLDEAASLGYMSCIEQAMTGYAGFNITLWQIFQDMSQLKAIYGDRWETIWGNSDVRQVFGVRDLFSQEYVSKSLGMKTITKYKRDLLGNVTEVETRGRELATPDEVRGFSQDYMFIFTGENPVMLTPKLPYYLLSRFKKDGKDIYEQNPYIDKAA